MPFWTGRRAIGGIVLAIVLIALGWAAVVVAVAVHAARDEATGADAIAVLGAAQYNGRPSPVFRARLNHAAALYQRGLAPVVLVTGGVGARDTLNEANVGRDYLVRLGLAGDAVVPLAGGADTYASIDQVRHWFDGKASRRGRSIRLGSAWRRSDGAAHPAVPVRHEWIVARDPGRAPRSGRGPGRVRPTGAARGGRCDSGAPGASYYYMDNAWLHRRADSPVLGIRAQRRQTRTRAGRIHRGHPKTAVRGAPAGAQRGDK